MTPLRSRSSRRSFLKSAAPAIAGSIAALHGAPALLAEGHSAAKDPARGKDTSAETKKLWSNEYWAQRGDV